jgi:hypothetical protein
VHMKVSKGVKVSTMQRLKKLPATYPCEVANGWKVTEKMICAVIKIKFLSKNMFMSLSGRDNEEYDIKITTLLFIVNSMGLP